MQTFNRGEWSEAYVFLYVLDTGIVKEQTFNNDIEPGALEVLSVIKNTKDGMYIINKDDDGNIHCLKNGIQIGYATKETLNKVRINCLDIIKASSEENSSVKKNSKGAFEIPNVEKFYVNDLHLDINIIKSSADKKDDIILKVRNQKDSSIFTEGFSIKSKLGSLPTLFNTSKASALVYTIKNLTPEMKETINNFFDKRGSKDICKRFSYLQKLNGVDISFQNSKSVNSYYGEAKLPGSHFAWNLEILDLRILFVLSEMLKIYFSEERISDVAGMIAKMAKDNPLDVKFPESFYEAKMRQFLFASFCGLTASAKWDGKQKVNGGYIEVQEEGEVLYQKALSDEKFTDYLISNTKFDTPSSGSNKWDYGDIYFDPEYNSECIDLNFQIRFK